MPVFLLPLLQFLGSKAGIYTMLAVAGVIGFFVFIDHERSVGAAAEVTKEQAATAKEHDRRELAEQNAQTLADAMVKRLAQIRDQNAKKQKVLDAPGAAGPCLSGDDVEQLRGAGSGR